MPVPSEYEVRKEKVSDLRMQGINPYPTKVERSHRISEVFEQFETLQSKETLVHITGRIRLFRKHGGVSFMQIEDQSGSIQLFIRKDELGEDVYEFIKEFMDVGDFVGASGQCVVTKTGEQSIMVSRLDIISKAIQPLPDKWHGLKDHEARYRKRYVDLIMNKDVRDLFVLKSKFIQSFRAYLMNGSFLEVETPILEHVPGGAEAEPFVTKHNTLEIDLFLRISLELGLKRLMVGGYERIFEIGRVFRNEGMSTQHLQEFTMMEMYWAYADHEALMSFVESMYMHVIKDVTGSTTVRFGDHELDFAAPWPRIDYVDIIKEKTGIDIMAHEDVGSLKKAIKSKKIDITFEKTAGLGRVIDQLYKKTVRPGLIQPSFLINHPTVISPLAKQKDGDPQRVNRFQILVAGAELGNGFAELNDPIDQRARFEAQLKLREAGDPEAHMYDDDFVNALEYGMPPTAGFGVGIDRLFMVVMNQPSIRDVVFFPTMKPKDD